MPRILLLLATTTYRAADFMEAAAELGVEVVVGSDHRQALADQLPGSALELDFSDITDSTERVVAVAGEYPLDAIIAAEDEGAIVAATASAVLGLPHNPIDSVHLARYKDRMREALARAGLPSPDFRVFPTDLDPRRPAREVRYPCVLKPVSLSASRGVIRADEADEFVAAFHRIRRILEAPDVRERAPHRSDRILAEDFIPGIELALEGLLTDGRLRVLAIFDKPDPLEGPYFEETYYITPSRRPDAEQRAVVETVSRTCEALGLRHGPVHAEVRVNDEGVWMIEIAPRSIGGLCSRTLRFGTGISLEELIIRHATGHDVEQLSRERRAAGVLMLPLPERGILREVRGIDEAEAVAGVEGVTISVPVGQEVVPLPEGHRYLGFMFARAETPERVEAALREAHRRLEPVVEPGAPES